MIVVDVNVLAYLILGGPEQGLAQRVLHRDSDWAAPLLWRNEFRSILAAYMRQRDLGIDDALRAHDWAVRVLSGREFTVSAERVLELVAKSPCTAYDCEYVALAEELDVPLITADRQVLRAFPRRARSPKSFAGES